MSWLKLSLDATREQLDATEDALLALGAGAVTVLPLGDELAWEPAPGATPSASNNRIEALLPLATDMDMAALSRQLSQRLPAAQRATLETAFVGEQDWQALALQHAVTACFAGRLWLLPKAAPLRPGACVRMDPGLAFGTGSHPTTRLCLAALASQPPVGADVLDYGCGSGVLGIAAMALGASACVAVDHDPQALAATRDNAGFNAVQCLACAPQALDLSRRFDLVVANILAGPLIELAPTLESLLRPAGRLLLAGLLTEQADAVMAAYPRVRFNAPAQTDVDGQWRLCSGVRDD